MGATKAELAAKVFVVLRRGFSVRDADGHGRHTRFPLLGGASSRAEIPQRDPAPIRDVPQSHRAFLLLNNSTKWCSLSVRSEHLPRIPDLDTHP